MPNEIAVIEINEVSLLSYNEAAELTEAIKSTASALHILLRKAHDDRAWEALGYGSWKSYIESEFDFSRARAYQLIDQSRVIEEISTAAGVDMFITEKDARVIKKRLPEITEKISEETNGLDEDEARDKAQMILEAELSSDEEIDMVSSSKPKEVNYSFEDDEEGEEVAGSHNKDKMPSREISGEDKFFLENLDRTLSIFEAMPGPSEMAGVIKGHSDEKELKRKIEFTYSWIIRLLDEIES